MLWEEGMNREQTIEAIKVMQAWVDGKTIQVKGDGDTTWADAGSVEIESRQPGWQWKTNVYRIKPEPRTVYLAEFSNGALDRHLLDEHEVRRYADPRMIPTRLVKFVEVMEDEAKGASIPAVKAVPPQHLPGTGPLVIGDRVQFTGSLQGIPKGSLATVTAANPTDPTVGVEFDGGQRHKGFTVWRTSLERVNDPSPPEEYDHAF